MSSNASPRMPATTSTPSSAANISKPFQFPESRHTHTDTIHLDNSEIFPRLGSPAFPCGAFTATSCSALEALPLADHPRILTEPLSTRTYGQIFTGSSLDEGKLPRLVSRVSTVSAVSSRAASPSRSVERPTTPQSPNAHNSSASKACIRSRHRPTKSLLNNFLSNYSSPGPEEYPEPEYFEMESPPSSYTCSPVRRSRVSSSASVATTVSGKLSWFTSRALSGITSTRPSTSNSKSAGRFSESDDDPLLSLDVQTALFPHGPPDPFAASSFNDLLMNAESVISWLQGAYKSNTEALNILRAEEATQIDELEEAKMRAQHLKTQLDIMSVRAADQERVLNTRIADERRRRLEAEEMWQQAREDQLAGTRAWRSPSSSNSDSGFESDEGSPVLGPQEVEGPENENENVAEKKRNGSPAVTARRARMGQSGPPKSSARPFSAMPCSSGGVDLRTENVRLRMRIAELENTMDACLDMVTFGV